MNKLIIILNFINKMRIGRALAANYHIKSKVESKTIKIIIFFLHRFLKDYFRSIFIYLIQLTQPDYL